MKLVDLHARLLGSWTGGNTLWLSWLPNPETKSAGKMSVAPVAKGKFLTFTYTWEHEGKEQEGFLLVGNDNKEDVATASWVDSWHQSGKVLSCEGKVREDGSIVLLGHYPAPPGPDWGWRITLTTPAPDELRMDMTNISPEGVEDPAVRADYTRLKS
jgi:hypothetical protein